VLRLGVRLNQAGTQTANSNLVPRKVFTVPFDLGNNFGGELLDVTRER